MVASAQHAIHRILWQIRVGVVLVHERDVIENVLLFNQHLSHAGVQDHREFASKGWIVCLAIWDGCSHKVTGAILVLQTLTGQSGTSRSGAQ